MASGTIPAFPMLRKAPNYATAYANAKSVLVFVLTHSNGQDNWVQVIPKVAIKTTNTNWIMGNAYSSSSLNHVQTTVSTTACTMRRFFNSTLQTGDTVTYYYL